MASRENKEKYEDLDLLDFVILYGFNFLVDFI
jgi:hypothetical protein